jgi:hypothetical protein
MTQMFQPPLLDGNEPALPLVIAKCEARRWGFSEVQTGNGWIALDEWTPYGDPDHRLRFDPVARVFEDVMPEGVLRAWVYRGTDSVVLGRWPVR